MTAALTLSSVTGVACLAIALGALAFAGGRLASLVAPRGGERLLAAATVVGTLVVAQSLALGIAELGTSQPALAGSALAIALVAAALLPRPEVSFATDLLGRWDAAGPTGRTLAGGAVGLAIGWAALALFRPSLDLDSALYDLPQIAGWVENGKPGSIELISFVYPIGNYPLTNEIVNTWLGSVSGNLGFVLLWPPVAAGLLTGGVYLALRAVGCTVGIAALAAVTALLVPVVAESLTSLDSDLPSTAWAAVAVALCARVASGRGSPELIPFAILAIGLAIGTKATVAPIVLAALMIALVAAPRRPRLAPVLVALGAAVIIGGLWYLRNFIDHGSPLWPFGTFPAGDPLPPTLDYLSAPFIGSPIDTLDGRVGQYLGRLGAGVLLIVAAIGLPLLTSDRRLKLAGAAVALSLLLWTLAPATGEPEGPDGEIFPVSGARYLMGTIVLAIGVVAALASRWGRPALAARAVLGMALIWGLVSLVAGRDGVPPAHLLALAAAAGAAVAWLLAHPGPRRGVALAAVGVCVLGAGAALAAYPDAFLSRFAAPADDVENTLEDASASYADLALWLDGDEDYRDGSDPVYFTEVAIGPLTGGGIDHPIRLLPGTASCEEAAGIVPPGGWVVVGKQPGADPAAVAGCFSADELRAEVTTSTGSAYLVFRRS